MQIAASENCRFYFNNLIGNTSRTLKIYLTGVRFVVGKSTVKQVKTFTFAPIGLLIKLILSQYHKLADHKL